MAAVNRFNDFEQRDRDEDLLGWLAVRDIYHLTKDQYDDYLIQKIVRSNLSLDEYIDEIRPGYWEKILAIPQDIPIEETVRLYQEIKDEYGIKD